MEEQENWFHMLPDTKKEYIDRLCTEWRGRGFPHYSKDEYNPREELYNIQRFNERSIVCGKDLNQTMHGCGFLWTYFPHWVEVRCGDGNSTIENWNDDRKLRELIEKTHRYEVKHGNGRITLNRLRQNTKVYCSKQAPSNFRPTVAKYIYNTYGNNGSVWDMSGGFGGRLLGFLASNCQSYVATEPCTKTYNGLQQMCSDYEYVGKQKDIYQVGSEDFRLPKESIDLCFTSPPYFDTEKYSTEYTQSYVRFGKKEEWINGFLRSTIRNCMYCLKPGGAMIINIANVKTFKDLEDRTVQTAKEEGFKHEDTLYLILSSIAGAGVKREPVFIFRK